ncbi:uncharacterized protein LOC111077222 [Drosophila obscura]|uniref:uncharacterized protein LOC111077222 n=1 Tax=Drosophila obscura TaxID=7282 RepID=UPI001BB1CD61|nr:uncharacterized protein LOC111077222 [Drosophila obscura]XP_022227101.2 uncharacterized protein LOC111077222 [Drosophila obscura]XP_022227102.2 uncharacterized protein LOC111077222 [Drosophila obscura]XP_022227103.2 uncharacterized protein LOC111077222 [Drosophila obscura]XP_022227104.2 uncharacterized protein LOC111077222 [Drosophila obscura]
MADNGHSWGLLQLFLAASLLASLPGGSATGGKVPRWLPQQGAMPGQEVLAAVPASGRVSFLLYQLALAINSAAGLEPQTIQEVEVAVEQEQEHQEQLYQEWNTVTDPHWLAAMANEYQNVPVYETFAGDLQHWLAGSYGLSATDVYRSWHMARSRGGTGSATQVICAADGQCYQVSQIVTACCPF